MISSALMIPNGEAIPLQEIPVVSVEDFSDEIVEAVANGDRLAAFFGRPLGDAVRLLALLARPSEGSLAVLSADVEQEYPSLTPDCPQAHWFEREVAEQWSIRPVGHLWLKPIRFHTPYRGGSDGAKPEPAVTEYYQVQGDEIHEVAVGPVHAGIIEPGHFRFQCHGEHVFHLEISLGFQHRGIEQSLVGGPNARTIHYMETLAGDTTIGHTLAYCQAAEALSACHVPARAHAIRGIALELERIANHIGDLGALAGDVGFLPTASYCGRIRGDALNLAALLCGSRFGRGLLRPGGAAFDIEPARLQQCLQRLASLQKDAKSAIDLLWENASVMARFEDVGCLTKEVAEEIGLVGPSARACGLERDVRQDAPLGIYQFFQIPVSTWHTGDVFARAYVRWMEIQRSIQFIEEQLQSLPGGPIAAASGPLAPDSFVASLTEGWRGEICHAAITDSAGRLAHYKVVDPSFHNWFGLAYALRGQQISDFPLCNKSFNLSYCGHDL